MFSSSKIQTRPVGRHTSNTTTLTKRCVPLSANRKWKIIHDSAATIIIVICCVYYENFKYNIFHTLFETRLCSRYKILKQKRWHAQMLGEALSLRLRGFNLFTFKPKINSANIKNIMFSEEDCKFSVNILQKNLLTWSSKLLCSALTHMTPFLLSPLLLLCTTAAGKTTFLRCRQHSRNHPSHLSRSRSTTRSATSASSGRSAGVTTRITIALAALLPAEFAAFSYKQSKLWKNRIIKVQNNFGKLKKSKILPCRRRWTSASRGAASSVPPAAALRRKRHFREGLRAWPPQEWTK